MNIIIAVLIVSVLPVSKSSQEPVVPFGKYSISVETNDARNRPRGIRGISVYVSMQRGNPMLSDTSTSRFMHFPGMPRGLSQVPDSHLAVFFEASEAAITRSPFRKEVESETYQGVKKTVIETVEDSGFSTIRVSSDDEEAIYADTEGEKLKTAIKEARIGRAWFKKLVSSLELPKRTADARPPRSNGYLVNVVLGEVDCGEFKYEISLTTESGRMREVRYRVRHGLRAFNSDGVFVRGLSSTSLGVIEIVEEALDAASNNESFEFELDQDQLFHGRARDEADRRSIRIPCRVSARSGSDTVDFYWFPRQIRPNANEYVEAFVGQFDRNKLKAIQDLINDCEKPKDWFKSHERLFFTPN